MGGSGNYFSPLETEEAQGESFSCFEYSLSKNVMLGAVAMILLQRRATSEAWSQPTEDVKAPKTKEVGKHPGYQQLCFATELTNFRILSSLLLLCEIIIPNVVQATASKTLMGIRVT